MYARAPVDVFLESESETGGKARDSAANGEIFSEVSCYFSINFSINFCFYFCRDELRSLFHSLLRHLSVVPLLSHKTQ